MPALPKLDDIGGLVGTVEVPGEHNVEHESYTYSHVAVPAEIIVQLQCIGETGNPPLDTVQ